MAIFRDDPFEFLTGQLSDHPVPRAISEPGQGGKFTHDGAVQHWPGNTFICHIAKNSDPHAALCAMQDAMRASDVGALFSWLPPASFHMTVFQGISPDDPVWPVGLPRDLSRDEVTKEFLSRLQDVSVPQHLTPTARGLHAGHSVTLEGKDAAAEARLRGARMALRDATGLHPHGFDTYTFHITLGYPLRWMTAAEAKAVIAASDAAFAAHGAALAEIPLGPVEFCTFENMHHFEPVLRLS
ncbi:hypothetical protein TRM7557_01575 [Tritonibacter multivorans]|uniref:DUF1868 domain-containing protein n=1 Tax=Tritonibacter multivorans TaxID=928856 RepID=A0A0P1G896_9RHOB|nr:DUF1868 domain-containing protein [Tritonibacter multivorans]MDA7422276.1 DUF1868 domain-containing protein [Tritonibacter multivorans]CUH77775.1 hypothetical protein TRM7557_01575 [Tritonibacter multivorans]SFD11909.1 hypothetical protein SAMN04488049_10772 [Tritonibacter multivorans]